MKTSGKDMMNHSINKKMNGMEFRESTLHEDAGLMMETSLEFGLDAHELKSLKKKMERS